MRVYIAAPLFSQMQRQWNRELAECLKTAFPGAIIVLPQDFRPAGCFNDARHYRALFRKCLAEIDRCEVMLAVLDGSDVDSGTAFEMGVAQARGKPIIGLRTDYRPGAEHGVNLMCARACRYLLREFAFQEDIAVVAAAVARRLKKIQKAAGNA